MTVKEQVLDYCARIGADPLLVQGAGGNVSWKQGGTLWIKASGTWLADALRRDIFVALDLVRLQSQLAAGNVEFEPGLHQASSLRPSIETLLHALMPYPVVVHLHAVEVLAHLVRRDCGPQLAEALNGHVCWTWVDYHKPGPELARAVQAALRTTPGAQVVLLKNHGVVIGGAHTEDIDRILRCLTARLAVTPRPRCAVAPPGRALAFFGADAYVPAPDELVHQLATDLALYACLQSCWALYPDHVVFLGPRAYAFASTAALETALKPSDAWPALVFVRALGAFVRPGFDHAKLVQLRCYYDVMVRQAKQALDTLNARQVGELLNWDAEHYRMLLAQQQ